MTSCKTFRKSLSKLVLVFHPSNIFKTIEKCFLDYVHVCTIRGLYLATCEQIAWVEHISHNRLHWLKFFPVAWTYIILVVWRQKTTKMLVFFPNFNKIIISIKLVLDPEFLTTALLNIMFIYYIYNLYH
jgi:hypothetical protein